MVRTPLIALLVLTLVGASRPLPKLHLGAGCRSLVRRFLNSAASSGGVAGGGGMLGRYLRCNAQYPIRTAFGTSAVLWIAGDTIAQKIESQGQSKPINKARLIGTTLEGSLMGGAVGCVWYQVLDRIASHKLGFLPGTMKFVAAKLSLEFLFWHPISLISFWVSVGLIEGHNIQRIRKELQKEFLPTLLSEYCLWTPVDLFSFWRVPVQFQVLVANAGSLVEAVGLSYIHEHGFPGLSNEKCEKQEASSVTPRKPKLPYIDAVAEALLLPTTEQLAREEFAKLDDGKRGFITSSQIRQKMASWALPGSPDKMVGAKAAELLVRKADVNGDGKVSLDEYLRLVKGFERVKYREEFTSDVVHALFDANGDGFIDRSELGKCATVLTGSGRKSIDSDAVLRAADVNHDGQLSKEELRRAMALIKRQEE